MSAVVKHSCGYDDVYREIQGIAIKNHSTYTGDHVINMNTFFPEKDVEFPASEEEEIIITYKDKCLNCDEYVGEPYNIVYKYKSVYYCLNTEYNGRIHSFKALEDVNEIDNLDLNPTQKYVCLELSGYHAPFDDIIKLYIQKSEWNKINERNIELNKRPLKVDDILFDLVIDKQNRVLNYSLTIDKKDV